jgi:hypothetical protein
MPRSIVPALVVALVLGVAAGHALAQVTFNTDVPAGKWKALRLRNLPKGVVVDLMINTSGDMGVAVMDFNSYRRFPNVARPLFRARIVTRLRVSVKMPEAGDYVVVLDNRASQEPRQVGVTARARRGRGKPEGGTPPRPEPLRGEPEA